MKKKIYFTLLVLMSSFSYNYAMGPMDFGIRAGLSTPNDEIANVFHKDKLQLDSLSGDLILEAMQSGYHLGVKLRFDIPVTNLSLVGGIGYHRFPQASSEVLVGDITYEIGTSLNIIPITLDAQYQLLDLKLFALYAQGGLSYNQLVYSIDYNNIPIPLQSTVQSSGTDNRLGVGFGGGIDISLALLSVNIYADYNITNIIGTESNEGSKEFLSVGVGLWF